MLGASSGSGFSGTDVGASARFQPPSARSQPSGRPDGWETRTLSQGPRTIARVCGGWEVGVTLTLRVGLSYTLIASAPPELLGPGWDLTWHRRQLPKDVPVSYTHLTLPTN